MSADGKEKGEEGEGVQKRQRAGDAVRNGERSDATHHPEPEPEPALRQVVHWQLGQESLVALLVVVVQLSQLVEGSTDITCGKLISSTCMCVCVCMYVYMYLHGGRWVWRLLLWLLNLSWSCNLFHKIVRNTLHNREDIYIICSVILPD